MSNELAVSMDELERESAELLPNRETLCCASGHSRGSSYFFVSNGNTAQSGILDFSFLNGNNVNILGNATQF